MVHYTEAMRGKRRLFFGLVVILVGLMAWMWLGHSGPWTLALGWAALLGGVLVGNAVLCCPACGKKMSSLFEKICSHCGAVLTDRAVVPPALSAPADEKTLAYMAESRRILARFAAVRRMLGRATVWVGALGGLAVFVFVWLSGPEHHNDAVVLGVFMWPVTSGVYWLVLIYGVDNLFALGFQVMRCRCPVCRAWLNLPSTIGFEAVHVDLILPKFCAHCSAKLS